MSEPAITDELRQAIADQLNNAHAMLAEALRRLGGRMAFTPEQLAVVTTKNVLINGKLPDGTLFVGLRDKDEAEAAMAAANKAH